MPTEPIRKPDPDLTGTQHEDEAIPAASDDHVLEETARLAREGRKEREADPKEPKPAQG
jgi:hypothetical protein